MKILIYLYYPMYEEHLAGGVQVWIKDLIEYIEQKDKTIKFQIVCPDGNDYEFVKNINVDHSLIDMERDFLTPRDIYNNMNLIKQYEKEADIIWMIDRNFPIESTKPKLLSLNTLCYERELMSIFQSKWNKMVVLTQFVKNQVVDYVNSSELFEIPCYVDPIFLNVEIDANIMNKYFDYNPKYKYILFPHRPDPDKGHFTAIDILKELIKKNKNYRLLIPLPPQAKEINVDRENSFINEVKRYVMQNNMNEYVIFHEWINYKDIPMYYKIGEFTLFLSKLPETFGLTLLNSVSVGTPVLSYGTGALNEVVPPGNAHFNFKDISTAVDIILKGKENFDIDKDKENVIKKYDLDIIANKYIELFKELYKGEKL
ncbi:MAG: glycosyltransferase family 4 protein [bacterium]|nr:glycosyltransferase family 4 protein [bacterium]